MDKLLNISPTTENWLQRTTALFEGDVEFIQELRTSKISFNYNKCHELVICTYMHVQQDLMDA